MVLTVFIALASSGCLHTYHDYGKPGTIHETADYHIWGGGRLFHQPGDPIDGKIIDSSAVYWGMSWSVLPVGSLANCTAIEYDSLTIWSADTGDTLRCDSAGLIGARTGHSIPWQCSRITFARLHSPQISVRMVLRFLDADDHLLARREVLLTHDLRKTVEHSDY